MDKFDINRKAVLEAMENNCGEVILTPEASAVKTHMLDELLIKAVRKGATNDAEADLLIEHFHNTIDDAESYFGLEYSEDRAEAMYSGEDFSIRNE